MNGIAVGHWKYTPVLIWLVDVVSMLVAAEREARQCSDTDAPSDPIHLSCSPDAQLFIRYVAGIHYLSGIFSFITQINSVYFFVLAKL